jgi:VanZ family protein
VAVALETIRFRLERLGWWPTPAVICLALWGLFIAYATLLPFDFSASGEQVAARLRLLWERPWSVRSRADAIGNVLLFLPWGFLLAIWRAGRGRSLVATLCLALLSGAALSGSLELTQLFAPSRYPSVIDLATNTFGSVVGASVGWPVARWALPIASIRIRQLIGSRPLAGCALATAVGLVLARLVAGTWKAATRKVRPIPFGSLAGLWAGTAELLTWMLVGGVFALAARESGRRGARALSWAVACGVGLRLAMEAVRRVIAGREVDPPSVVLATLGSAVGASTVAFAVSRDARRWITPALVIWGLVAVLGAWNPPRFTWPHPPFWRPEWVVPFWSYFDSRSLANLGDLIEAVLVFAPMGALLAARSWRQSFLGAALIGLGLGVGLEIGQVFIPGRTADLTDALSAAAGAGLGWSLWRWGESLRKSSQGAARYRVGMRPTSRTT